MRTTVVFFLELWAQPGTRTSACQRVNDDKTETLIGGDVRIVNQAFRELVESLEPQYWALMAVAPVRFVSLPKRMPERGIYLFSEGSADFYDAGVVSTGVRLRLGWSACRTTVDSAALTSRRRSLFGSRDTPLASPEHPTRRRAHEANSSRTPSLDRRLRQPRSVST